MHFAFAWKFAYNASRKKFWEYFAADRERFHNRIKKCENIITPILDYKFRNIISEERFK